jgi:hypothetical protein
MGKMQCPFCGQIVDQDAISCYHCRETLPGRGGARFGNPAAGHHEIRRGLLYAFLAGVVHYFASGLSGYELPVQVPPAIPEYLTRFLFLGGAGLFLYGLILKVRG